jgi:hypothetical protein
MRDSITFNDDMIRAILEGRKTQTRRLIKGHKLKMIQFDALLNPEQHCPYGKPGDRLWVKETYHTFFNVTSICTYKADKPGLPMRWTPSIQMPKGLSRITLEITDVRVERVQEISSDDARAEGIDICKNCLQRGPCPMPGVCAYSFDAFKKLWQSIYPGSWESNDWVWVISFKVMQP